MAIPTHLKVGELARATGLTVRTLHHYDEIGLLKPSGRSESGYRLYAPADVTRLHGIQALRQMGLSLAEIGALFEGRGASPQAIVEQQVRALDREIERATELRGRLGLIGEQLAKGTAPDLAAWLQVLQEMATYGKYFKAGELKAIFEGYAPLKDDWEQLVADVQPAMDRGLAIDSPEVQGLARRWMALMLGWMKGDFALMRRWGDMYRQEAMPPGGKDIPPLAMIDFMSKAIELRMDVMRRHFTPEDLARFRFVPEREWRSLDAAILEQVERRRAASGAEGRALLQRWLGLMDRMLSGDAKLRDKVVQAGQREPLLAAGAPLSPRAREYLRDAMEQRGA